MSDDGRRFARQKREWAHSPPRQEPFGRGMFPGRGGPSFSGKRGRFSPRDEPRGYGPREPPRQGPPKFPPSRRDSPPMHDDLPPSRGPPRGGPERGLPGHHRAWGPPGIGPFGRGGPLAADGGRPYGPPPGEGRGPPGYDRRPPPPLLPGRHSGPVSGWDQRPERRDRERDHRHSMQRDAPAALHSSRESTPDANWRGGLPPPPRRDGHFGDAGDGLDGSRVSKSYKRERKAPSLLRTSTAPSASRDSFAAPSTSLPPPPPLPRTSSAPMHSPRMQRASSRSPSRRSGKPHDGGPEKRRKSEATTKSSEHKLSHSKASDAPKKPQKASSGARNARAKTPEPKSTDPTAAKLEPARAASPPVKLELEASQMSPVTSRDDDTLLLEGSPVSQGELLEGSPVSQGELPSAADAEPEAVSPIQAPAAASTELQAAPPAELATTVEAAAPVEPVRDTAAPAEPRNTAHPKPSGPPPAESGVPTESGDVIPPAAATAGEVPVSVPDDHPVGAIGLPPVPKLPLASTPAGTAQAVGSGDLTARTPASERSAGSGATPGDAPSDEPPKRKRLGWGQGLARLRSSDERATGDDFGDPRSPLSERRGSEDSKRAAVSQGGTLSKEHLDLPGRSPFQNAVDSTERDAGSWHSSDLARQVINGEANAGRANSEVEPFSPVSANGLATQLGSPVSKTPPGASTLQSPRATHGSGQLVRAEDAPMSPVSPMSPTTPRVAQATPEKPPSPQLSKDAILAALEDVDAEITERSNRMAALAAEQSAMVQSLKELDDEEARLARPLPEPVLAASEEDDDSDVSEETQSSVDPGERLTNGFRSPKSKRRGRAAGDSPDPSISTGGSSDSSSETSYDAQPFSDWRTHVTHIIAQNRELAQASITPFFPLLPEEMRPQPGSYDKVDVIDIKWLYRVPEDLEIYKRNLENGDRIRSRALEVVRRRRQDSGERAEDVALQYRELHDQWRAYFQEKLGGNKREERVEKGDRSASLSRAASRKVAAVRSEKEERGLVRYNLALYRLNCQTLLPDQILDAKERERQRFPSQNALVEDPVALLEQEGALRPWSPDEKRVFMDKFLAYPKDFHMIASFLDHRSTQDCVQFYYKTQKLDEFAAVRRKQQLKKRRLQSDINRGVTYMGIAGPGKGAARIGITGASGRVAAAAAVTVEPVPTGRGGKGLRTTAKPGRGRLAAAAVGSAMGGSAVDLAAEALATAGSAAMQLAEGSQAPVLMDYASSWTAYEEHAFLEGLQIYGRDFNSICRHMGTRTPGACKAYFQKNKVRLGLERLLEEREVEEGEVDPGFGRRRGKRTQQEQVPEPNDDTPRSPEDQPNGDQSLEAVPRSQHDPMQVDRRTPSPSNSQPLPPDFGQLQGLPPGYPPYFGMPGMNGAGPNFPAGLNFSGPLGPMGSMPTSGQLLHGSQALQGMHMAPPGIMGMGFGASGGMMPPSSVNAILQSLQMQLQMQPANLGLQGYAGLMAGMPLAGVPPQVAQYLIMQALQGRGQAFPPHMAGLPGFPGQLPAHLGGPFGGPQQQLAMMCALGGQMGPHIDGFSSEAMQQLQQQELLPPLDALQRTQQQAERADEPPVRDAGVTDSEGAGTAAEDGGRGAAPGSSGASAEREVSRRQMNHWTQTEKDAFIEKFKLHGRDWDRLCEAAPNKTMLQVKNYYQNYKTKLGLDRMTLPPTAIQPGSRKRTNRADSNDSPSLTPSATPPPGSATQPLPAPAPEAGTAGEPRTTQAALPRMVAPGPSVQAFSEALTTMRANRPTPNSTAPPSANPAGSSQAPENPQERPALLAPTMGEHARFPVTLLEGGGQSIYRRSSPAGGAPKALEGVRRSSGEVPVAGSDLHAPDQGVRPPPDAGAWGPGGAEASAPFSVQGRPQGYTISASQIWGQNAPQERVADASRAPEPSQRSASMQWPQQAADADAGGGAQGPGLSPTFQSILADMFPRGVPAAGAAGNGDSEDPNTLALQQLLRKPAGLATSSQGPNESFQVPDPPLALGMRSSRMDPATAMANASARNAFQPLQGPTIRIKAASLSRVNPGDAAGLSGRTITTGGASDGQLELGLQRLDPGQDYASFGPFDRHSSAPADLRRVSASRLLGREDRRSASQPITFYSRQQTQDFRAALQQRRLDIDGPEAEQGPVGLEGRSGSMLPRPGQPDGGPSDDRAARTWHGQTSSGGLQITGSGGDELMRQGSFFQGQLGEASNLSRRRPVWPAPHSLSLPNSSAYAELAASARTNQPPQAAAAAARPSLPAQGPAKEPGAGSVAAVSKLPGSASGALTDLSAIHAGEKGSSAAGGTAVPAPALSTPGVALSAPEAADISQGLMSPAPDAAEELLQPCQQPG